MKVMDSEASFKALVKKSVSHQGLSQYRREILLSKANELGISEQSALEVIETAIATLSEKAKSIERFREAVQKEWEEGTLTEEAIKNDLRDWQRDILMLADDEVKDIWDKYSDVGGTSGKPEASASKLVGLLHNRNFENYNPSDFHSGALAMSHSEDIIAYSSTDDLGILTAFRILYTDISVYNLKTSTCILCLEGDVLKDRETEKFYSVRSLALSPDNTLLASSGNGIDIWDITSGKRLLKIYDRSIIPVNPNICFLPCGTQIMAFWQKSVRVFNVSDGSLRSSFEVDAEYNMTVMPDPLLSPSGKVLAAIYDSSAFSSTKPSIQLLDVYTGRKGMALKCSSKYIYNMSFSSSGEMLAARCGGNTIHEDVIRLWDCNSGAQFPEIHLPSTSDEGFALSPCGQTVAYSKLRAICLYNVKAEKEVFSIAWNIKNVPSLTCKYMSFTTDGKYLVVADNKKNIGIFKCLYQE